MFVLKYKKVYYQIVTLKKKVPLIFKFTTFARRQKVHGLSRSRD